MNISNIFKKTGIVLVLLLIISCGNNVKNTYPFSKSEYIEVISYENRMNWDTINGMSKDFYDYTILEKDRIDVFKKNTIENIKLNEEQKEQLLDILYNTNCTIFESSGCYEPRHSFVFYDADEKPFASIEVCLDCYNSRETKGLEKIDFCEKKIKRLKGFLEKIGIKHFDEK